MKCNLKNLSIFIWNHTQIFELILIFIKGQYMFWKEKFPSLTFPSSKELVMFGERLKNSAEYEAHQKKNRQNFTGYGSMKEIEKYKPKNKTKKNNFSYVWDKIKNILKTLKLVSGYKGKRKSLSYGVELTEVPTNNPNKYSELDKQENDTNLDEDTYRYNNLLKNEIRPPIPYTLIQNQIRPIQEKSVKSPRSAHSSKSKSKTKRSPNSWEL
uniref:Uncharacterized protein n=1 Tax=viral metagenome TaxID=1070528 RepID=A0A6C0HRK7_9ZZZZ